MTEEAWRSGFDSGVRILLAETVTGLAEAECALALTADWMTLVAEGEINEQYVRIYQGEWST